VNSEKLEVESDGMFYRSLQVFFTTLLQRDPSLAQSPTHKTAAQDDVFIGGYCRLSTVDFYVLSLHAHPWTMDHRLWTFRKSYAPTVDS
jgi:hypothetical protein